MSEIDCSVAIKCADDLRIERCIDSIDDSTVSVNAVITPSNRIQAILAEREIPYVITEYGNIARSAQLSVEKAEHDHVIVMDSDAFFAAGAITKIRDGLLKAPVVKPRVSFLSTGGYLSNLVAANRSDYYSIPNHAMNPGMGLNRTEVAELCGYVFNPHVRWVEDTDLNYRLHLHNVPILDVPDALIYHDTVTLKHELSGAFYYGVGKRLSIEDNPDRPAKEEVSELLSAILEASSWKNLVHNLSDQSLGRNMLAAAWRIIYLGGYHAQKHTGNWTVHD